MLLIPTAQHKNNLVQKLVKTEQGSSETSHHHDTILSVHSHSALMAQRTCHLFFAEHSVYQPKHFPNNNTDICTSADVAMSRAFRIAVNSSEQNKQTPQFRPHNHICFTFHHQRAM